MSHENLFKNKLSFNSLLTKEEKFNEIIRNVRNKADLINNEKMSLDNMGHSESNNNFIQEEELYKIIDDDWYLKNSMETDANLKRLNYKKLFMLNFSEENSKKDLYESSQNNNSDDLNTNLPKQKDEKVKTEHDYTISVSRIPIKNDIISSKIFSSEKKKNIEDNKNIFRNNSKDKVLIIKKNHNKKGFNFNSFKSKKNFSAILNNRNILNEFLQNKDKIPFISSNFEKEKGLICNINKKVSAKNIDVCCQDLKVIDEKNYFSHQVYQLNKENKIQRKFINSAKNIDNNRHLLLNQRYENKSTENFYKTNLNFEKIFNVKIRDNRELDDKFFIYEKINLLFQSEDENNTKNKKNFSTRFSSRIKKEKIIKNKKNNQENTRYAHQTNTISKNLFGNFNSQRSSKLKDFYKENHGVENTKNSEISINTKNTNSNICYFHNQFNKTQFSKGKDFEKNSSFNKTSLNFFKSKESQVTFNKMFNSDKHLHNDNVYQLDPENYSKNEENEDQDDDEDLIKNGSIFFKDNLRLSEKKIQEQEIQKETMDNSDLTSKKFNNLNEIKAIRYPFPCKNIIVKKPLIKIKNQVEFFNKNYKEPYSSDCNNVDKKIINFNKNDCFGSLIFSRDNCISKNNNMLKSEKQPFHKQILIGSGSTKNFSGSMKIETIKFKYSDEMFNRTNGDKCMLFPNDKYSMNL